jgi:hypothetical protein
MCAGNGNIVWIQCSQERPKNTTGGIDSASAVGAHGGGTPVVVETVRCTILSGYIASVTKQGVDSKIQNLDSTTLNLSVAVAEQPVLVLTVLPFFNVCQEKKKSHSNKRDIETAIQRATERLPQLIRCWRLILRWCCGVAEEMLQSGILHFGVVSAT